MIFHVRSKLSEVTRPLADVFVGREAADLELGCRLEYPFMMVSILSLGVIPALRLTNRGLVDGVEFRLVRRS